VECREDRVVVVREYEERLQLHKMIGSAPERGRIRRECGTLLIEIGAVNRS
jgi:hypothetical protein